MSEAPKIDLSRIRVGYLGNALRGNQIALPKNNTADAVKASEVATQKNNTADAVKASEVATQKNNTADAVKASEVATQKNNAADAIKPSEIDTQKTQAADVIKPSEIDTQKTQAADAIKPSEIDNQKTQAADAIKPSEIDTQKTNTVNTVNTAKTSEVATPKNNVSGERKNVTESAKEIQGLLAPLQATYPINSAYEKQVFVNKFREEIRKNSHVQELLTSGGIELIKTLCQPLDIPLDMGKKWLTTAQHYQ